MRQQMYNPVDFHFQWTDDGWYDWDYQAGHKAALKARNAEARRLRKMGRRVTVFTLKSQMTRRGGIGSGHPDIEHVVNVYGLNVWLGSGA